MLQPKPLPVYVFVYARAQPPEKKNKKSEERLKERLGNRGERRTISAVQSFWFLVLVFVFLVVIFFIIILHLECRPLVQ